MAENADDVKKLFEQLKFEPSAKEVDATTLLSLLLYCDVDHIDPLFFSTLSKKVEALKSPKVTFEEFQKLFDFSSLNLNNLSKTELASFYRTFDKNVDGEIKYDEFIKDYKLTPEYTKNSSDKQKDAIDSIKKDFELINPQKLSITLEEFLSIVANQSNS